jgi:uncharacterized protein (DUF1330 family)
VSALMLVRMNITDRAWLKPYSEAVAEILADHGAVSVAFSRDVRAVEGDGAVPERMAIFAFPSIDAVHAFMADERYLPWRELRQAGAEAEILAFENEVTGGPLG